MKLIAYIERDTEWTGLTEDGSMTEFHGSAEEAGAIHPTWFHGLYSRKDPKPWIRLPTQDLSAFEVNHIVRITDFIPHFYSPKSGLDIVVSESMRNRLASFPGLMFLPVVFDKLVSLSASGRGTPKTARPRKFSDSYYEARWLLSLAEDQQIAADPPRHWELLMWLLPVLIARIGISVDIDTVCKYDERKYLEYYSTILPPGLLKAYSILDYVKGHLMHPDVYEAIEPLLDFRNYYSVEVRTAGARCDIRTLRP